MIELYVEQPGKLVLRELAPVPAPGPGEVKVKLLYGGICGSDLSVFKGRIPYAKYPGRAGHEALGVVIDAGAGTTFAVGQKVVTFPNTFCGECEFCRAGKTNVCKHKQSFGLNAPGVFASEVLVDQRFLVAVPDGMPDERAVLTEPFATVVHGLKKAGVTNNTSVAIVGCGTMGLLSAVFARHLGADVTVLYNRHRHEAVTERIGGLHVVQAEAVGETQFDVVVEAAGVKSSIELAMRLVKPGGALVALGITGEQVDFPVIHIVRSEITIYGSIIYTKADFIETLAYLTDPALPIDVLVSQILPVSAYQRGYEEAMSGEHVKIVLDFQTA